MPETSAHKNILLTHATNFKMLHKSVAGKSALSGGTGARTRQDSPEVRDHFIGVVRPSVSGASPPPAGFPHAAGLLRVLVAIENLLLKRGHIPNGQDETLPALPDQVGPPRIGGNN